MKLYLSYENRRSKSYQGIEISIESNEPEIAWKIYDAIKKTVTSEGGWHEK
jgi:hypothetical protein